MDSAFLHWFAGFVDGEGSFNISQQTNCQGWRAQFSIDLRDDDRPILEEIQIAIGIGAVYPRPTNGGSKPGCRWRVSSKSDCARLVEILSAHPLRARKRHDFAIWAEAVAAWQLKDYEAMRDCRERLIAGRSYPWGGTTSVAPASPPPHLSRYGNRGAFS